MRAPISPCSRRTPLTLSLAAMSCSHTAPSRAGFAASHGHDGAQPQPQPVCSASSSPSALPERTPSRCAHILLFQLCAALAVLSGDFCDACRFDDAPPPSPLPSLPPTSLPRSQPPSPPSNVHKPIAASFAKPVGDQTHINTCHKGVTGKIGCRCGLLPHLPQHAPPSLLPSPPPSSSPPPSPPPSPPSSPLAPSPQTIQPTFATVVSSAEAVYATAAAIASATKHALAVAGKFVSGAFTSFTAVA